MTIVSNRGTNGLLWFTVSNPDTGLTRRDHTIAHHLQSGSSTPHCFIQLSSLPPAAEVNIGRVGLLAGRVMGHQGEMSLCGA